MSNIARLMQMGAAGAAGGIAVDDVFSTDIYTGRTVSLVPNGLDLSNEGGLVWIKARQPLQRNHVLYDTIRGVGNRLFTNLNNAQSADGGDGLIAFESNGFRLGSDLGDFGVNSDQQGQTYVAWSFRKAREFFDLVTYTGDGTGVRNISHNLGTTVGMIIVKRFDGSQFWNVLHRDADAAKVMYLNSDSPQANDTFAWDSTHATPSHFTIGAGLNSLGSNYVVYLFAHEPSSKGIVQCGSYTGNGSTSGPSINLGWESQWVMIKNLNNFADWGIIDNVRGSTKYLRPNLNANENTPNYLTFNSTGFQLISSDARVNTSGDTYVYTAIRAEGA